jgi:hypothetical protein
MIVRRVFALAAAVAIVAACSTGDPSTTSGTTGPTSTASTAAPITASAPAISSTTTTSTVAPDTASRVSRISTPDLGCERSQLLENACNGGSEVQTLLNPPGTTRVYLGTTGWNDSVHRNAPAQVLYRDAELGPWSQTGRLPAPSVGPAALPLCEGFDQVNDLRTLSLSEGSDLLLAAVGSSFYEDVDCGAHGNVVVSVDGGATWQSTLLEEVLDAHAPSEATEVRYIAVHRDGTSECETTP